VQQLGVHQADAARLAEARDRLRQRLLLGVGRDRPVKRSPSNSDSIGPLCEPARR
jgi:hypothetical protein